MPRAFLITHRRYNGTEEKLEEHGEDSSPERQARARSYSGGHPTSDGASECGSETSSECPEELYNLTKLAEVSLAAAAGTLIHPNSVIYDLSTSRRVRSPTAATTTKQQHPRDGWSRFEEEGARNERTRLFFESIESEREILEGCRRRYPRLREKENLFPEEEPRPSPEDNPDVDRNDATQTSSSSVSSSTRKGTLSSSSNSSLTTSPSTHSSTENPKTEDSEEHECPDCGKKYSTSSNLARHRQTHRSLGDKKARRCPHCDKVYVSMPAFSMHVRTHNQGCKCHYCGKCFSRPWLLQGHIRTHTGEKPFKCTICNKAFADKSNLRAHIQTHSNTKPHVCGRCGKAFALKSYLYKHEESSCMRAHHRTTTEKGNSSPSFSSGKTSDAASSSKTATTATTTIATTTASTASSSPSSPPCVAASPTSVIVPRIESNREQRNPSAFSAIIRHTRTSEVTQTILSPSKRACKERTPCEDKRPANDAPVTESTIEDPSDRRIRDLSRMVIRTSVISPNPERLGCFAHEIEKSSMSSIFEYADSRSTPFSRPATAITFNLAIA